MALRQCNKCGLYKEERTGFTLRKPQPKVLRSGTVAINQPCRQCKNLATKKWIQLHPEYEKERSRERRALHPAQIKEAQRKYRERHSERIKTSSKERRELNPELYKEYLKKWKELHPGRMKEHENKYRSLHPERVKASRKKSKRREIDNISDKYLGELLGIPHKEVPKELLELKRLQLSIRRFLKETEK